MTKIFPEQRADLSNQVALDVAVQQLMLRPSAAIDLAEPVPITELPTPALVLNRPKFEANIERMAAHMQAHGKGFRPHAKTHKCAMIAQQQLDAGAVGICVAKLSEGLALATAGVEQLLVTSPVTTYTKAGLLVRLLQQSSQLQIVIDSSPGFEVAEVALNKLTQMGHDSVELGILIDVDVAMGRTGNRDSGEILKLIEQISHHPGMRFDGIQHYAGHLMHIESYAERRDKSLALWDKVAELVDELSQRAIACQVVTGGGTGTFDIDVKVPCLTDMQVGSYIFMDEEYRQIASVDSDRFEYFDASLSVACTTISQPTSKTITVDGGYKAFASDSVDPVCDELGDVRFRFAGDEHGVLIRPATDQFLKLGQVLQFVVPHCDPTVNLHEFYWVQEADEMVHSLWPINARGCSW